MQDLEFNFPDPPPPAESPHHLGFFAGVVVGASRVTIDLNGKTLSMHPHYRLKQRFFSLVSLDVTPFPPGKAKFSTAPVSPTDIVVRNGTLGLSSHFGIHGNTLRDGRIVLRDLRFEKFEVGAVSISGASDIAIRNCHIGEAVPPTSSSDENMLRDLARTAIAHGNHADANALMQMAAQQRRVLRASDAIVRAIVISPTFNVGPGVPPDTWERRISRVSVTDVQFAELRAEPMEVVGISMRRDDDGLKDANGNLIAMSDAVAGSFLSRTQAALNPELPRAARDRLVSGPAAGLFHPVVGLDRRGHSLQGKSSLFLRIDGCDDVVLHNLRGDRVVSQGPEAAAVGVMLNGCERVRIKHVRVGGVSVRGLPSGSSSNPLSDQRPQSGLLMRRCRHVAVDGYVYESEEACGNAFRHSSNATFRRCDIHAPSTFHRCRHIQME